MEGKVEKRMKILCLHGFRTSGSFLKKQISKWDPSIFAHFDMDFPDGLFPAGGKSEIEGIFPPPYFEWFQFEKEFTEYTNLEECISYLCDYITTKGPFDGLLGFSQGAALSGLLLGYQAQGKVLKDHPPMKLFVSISGSKFRKPSIAEIAYKEPIKVKSVHLIGDKDWLKLPSEDLAAEFHDPIIIRHPQGHTVPRLDEAAVEQLRALTTEILQESSKVASDIKDEVNNKQVNDIKHEGDDTVKETTDIKHVVDDKETIDIKHEVENKEANLEVDENKPTGKSVFDTSNGNVVDDKETIDIKHEVENKEAKLEVDENKPAGKSVFDTSNGNVVVKVEV